MKKIIVSLCFLLVFMLTATIPKLSADVVYDDNSVVAYYPIEKIDFYWNDLSYSTLNLNGNFSTFADEYYFSTLDSSNSYLHFTQSYLNSIITLSSIGGDIGRFSSDWLSISNLSEIVISFKDIYISPDTEYLMPYLSYAFNTFTYDITYLDQTDNGLIEIDYSGVVNNSTNILLDVLNDLSFNKNLSYNGLAITNLVIRYDYLTYGTFNNFIINFGVVEYGSPNGSLLPYLRNLNYNFNYLSWLANSVDAFLGTEIFGSLTLGHILLFIVAIPLVLALLKFFAGG